MRLTIVAVVILGVVIVGCSGPSSYNTPVSIPEMPEIPTLPERPEIPDFPDVPDATELPGDIAEAIMGAAEVDRLGFSDDLSELDQPPETANWIFPAKVAVDNYYQGAAADYPITVHNGNDEPAEFLASVKPTYRLDDGITITMLQEWVTLNKYTAVIQARSNEQITVQIKMVGYDAPLDYWEFYVCVSEDTGTNVITELCSRCEVSMR